MRLFLLAGVLLGASCAGERGDLSPTLEELGRLAFVSSETFDRPGGKSETIPDLLVDRFEVTNKVFLEFVSSTGYEGEGPGFLYHLPRVEDTVSLGSEQDNLPVVFVSMRDAQAFAASRGKRLPTRTEWIWLACQDSDPDFLSRFPFPWGIHWKSLYANTVELGMERATPVGTFEEGSSAFGCYDVAGNVWEWVQVSENGEVSESMGMIKGGSFANTKIWARCDSELWMSPEGRSGSIGFRCVAEFDSYFPEALRRVEENARNREILGKILKQWGESAMKSITRLEREGKLESTLLQRLIPAWKPN